FYKLTFTDDNGVEMKDFNGCWHYWSHENFRIFQAHATRLDAAPQALTLEEAEFAVRVLYGDFRGEVGKACEKIERIEEEMQCTKGLSVASAMIQSRAHWL